MKIIISQLVDHENDNFPYTWRKEFESVVIPRVGDYIESELWDSNDRYKVVNVTINYEKNECYVEMEKYRSVIPKDRKEEITHIAKLHEWEPLWDRCK